MGVIGRLRDYYCNDMRLSSKLLISHLTLIVVSTLAILTFYGSSIYNLLITTTINSKQQTAFSTAVSVGAQLDGLMADTESVADAFLPLIANGGLSGAEQFLNTIERIQGPDVTYQFYIDPDYAYLLRLPGLAPYLQTLDQVYGTYWYGIMSYQPAPGDLFCPSLYLSPGEIERYGDLAYISSLQNPFTGASIGYIVAYFPQKPIINALAQNLSVSRGASYIINSRDALVCDSKSELVGAYYINNNEIDRIVADGGNASYLGSDIIVGSYPVSRTDWKIVSIMLKKDALEDANRAMRQFFCIYGVVALASALLAVLLARSISGRIVSVVKQIGQTKNSRLERINSFPPSRDEVGQLVHTYNYMIDSVNNLMDRETEAAKTLRLSEFKALQAQINPHFLYNSLDMINWLARAQELEQVSEGIQALGRFYKLTLSKKDTFGTVSKETEHAVLYVKLQNMRYENRIRFVVDIDENIQNCVMPKLIFQPLVENAILHGIMEREDKQGEVLLAGWRDGDDLIFLLSDNGVGMTESQIEKIMQPNSPQSAGKTGTNIGIYNTHERLQLYYGPQYGLRYESTPGVGTEVYIRIPFSPES